MTLEQDDPRITAYALGELTGPEAAAFEQELANDPAARRQVEDIRALGLQLADGLSAEPAEELTDGQRQAVVAAAAGGKYTRHRWKASGKARPAVAGMSRLRLVPLWIPLAAAVVIAVSIIMIFPKFSSKQANTELASGDDSYLNKVLQKEKAKYLPGLGSIQKKITSPPPAEAQPVESKSLSAELEVSGDTVFRSDKESGDKKLRFANPGTPKNSPGQGQAQGQGQQKQAQQGQQVWAQRKSDLVGDAQTSYDSHLALRNDQPTALKPTPSTIVPGGSEGIKTSILDVNGKVNVNVGAHGGGSFTPANNSGSATNGALGTGVVGVNGGTVTASDSGELKRRGPSGEPRPALSATGNVTVSSGGLIAAADGQMIVRRERSVPAVVGQPGQPQENKQLDGKKSSDVPWWDLLRYPRDWPEITAGRPVNGPADETYNQRQENPFLSPRGEPLSTFSIDVDTASYANIRRMIGQGQLPPAGAVRVEEMINYFNYNYAPPSEAAGHPFAVHIDVAGCPWERSHRLVRIGLKGREVPVDERPASNLVFLLDVSGSMGEAKKLPLVKQAMKLLLEQLNENDRVGIVVYADNARVVLDSVGADSKTTIANAIEALSAGGCTNGAGGIQMAYKQAAANFIKKGTNRVILCTDGDFNVGITDRQQLVDLIQEQAKSGVFLSVLGFGMGNLKDATLELLADKGHGHYGYIDNLDEARKLFVEQLSGTLVTIAKDVKVQVEFNPAQVSSYRLIGYEKRLMAHEDFNNDRKDAGDIGAGHTVTALYEVVPAGQAPPPPPAVDPLKYQKTAPVDERPARADAASDQASNELLTVKLRYKSPDGKTSKLLEVPVVDKGQSLANAGKDFKFAAAVASYGMILRGSRFAGDYNLDAIEELASSGVGMDKGGYRGQFVELVKATKSLRR